MKIYKIIFWITTSLIFITQGVVEIFMLNNEEAISGIIHLGYPAYFFTMLAIFKLLGAIVLIIPKFPNRVREWAYAGFGIDFIAAFVSIWAVDGFVPDLIAPVIAMIVLISSYYSFYKIKGVF